LLQLLPRRGQFRLTLAQLVPARGDLLPVLFELISVLGNFRRAGAVSNIPPQLRSIALQLAKIVSQLTPILSHLIARIADFLEIPADLGLVVVAPIGLIYISRKTMTITPPMMSPPFVIAVAPPCMLPAPI